MKMVDPLVSIITPTYNHERYVKACIESVLAQSYTNWEQIIIDDASKDSTAEIIERYANTDQRMTLIRHKENYGIYRLADTYNEALNISKGKFVAILEGDDCWPPDKLGKQLKLFCNQRIVVTWGAGEIIDEDGSVLGAFPQAWKKWPDDAICNRPVGTALKILLFRFFLAPFVTIMFRRQTLSEIGGFSQPKNSHGVDSFTCLKMALEGEFLYSREILGLWRTHPTQVTSTLAHLSTTTASDEFFRILSDKRKRELGLEEMERSLAARSCSIRGMRLMVSGQRRQRNTARQLLIKALFANQGMLSVKSGIALVMSFVFPGLLQRILQKPLSVSTWLRQALGNSSTDGLETIPTRFTELTEISTQGAAHEDSKGGAGEIGLT